MLGLLVKRHLFGYMMKVKKGDKLWCISRRFSEPKLCVVIGLTSEPGRKVAAQFFERVPSGSSCGGRGIDGYCLWINPSNLITNSIYNQLMADLAKHEQYEELEEIEIES